MRISRSIGTAPRNEVLSERGAARFPFLANTGIVRRNCWAGLYETTPDHLPVLGRHPELPNYIDASGFSGHGVMHSLGHRISLIGRRSARRPRRTPSISTTCASPGSTPALASLEANVY